MVERIKSISDPKTKKAEKELSDAELAKVAGSGYDIKMNVRYP